LSSENVCFSEKSCKTRGVQSSQILPRRIVFRGLEIAYIWWWRSAPLENFPPRAIPFARDWWYSVLVFVSHPSRGALTMEWVTPKHEEIDLNCEVSSYANAEL